MAVVSTSRLGTSWSSVFQGMAMMNFAGCLDNRYQGTRLAHNFGQYLCEACIVQQNPFPTEGVYRGPLLSPLRTLLQRLNVAVWAEVTVGSSFSEYKGLDAYVRFFGSNIVSPEEEAWFLLNTEIEDAGQRELKRPEDWYSCKHWKSMGQKPTIAEHNLEYIATMVARTPQEYAASARRALYMLMQLVPHARL